MNYSAEELINLLKQNDRSAINYLYDNYSGALYGIALKILDQDEKAADEALQESFVKIWKGIGAYKCAEETLFTWMLKITRSTATDKLKLVKSKPIRPADDSVGMNGQEQGYKMNGDMTIMNEAIDKLRTEHKTLVNLIYYKGYSQEQVSEKLNIPLETVKMQTRAAFVELRRSFE